MTQAAAAWNVPLRVLKRAKSDGCPAFKHSRVNMPEFVTWYFNREQDDVPDINVERALREKAERERAQIELELLKGTSIRHDEVRDFINSTFSPVREDVVAMPGLLAAKVNPTNPALARDVLQGWSDQFIARRRARVPEEPTES